MSLPLPESTLSHLLGTRCLQQPFPRHKPTVRSHRPHVTINVPQSTGVLPPALLTGMPKAALPKLLLLLESPTSLGTDTSRKLWGPDWADPAPKELSQAAAPRTRSDQGGCGRAASGHSKSQLWTFAPGPAERKAAELHGPAHQPL